MIFFLMDKYCIIVLLKVMWGVDDNICGWIDYVYQLVIIELLLDKYEIEVVIEKVVKEVMEMIFKEEDIMLLMLDEVVILIDWKMVRDDEEEIGYILIFLLLLWKLIEVELEEVVNKLVNLMIVVELNKMVLNLVD